MSGESVILILKTPPLRLRLISKSKIYKCRHGMAASKIVCVLERQRNSQVFSSMEVGYKIRLSFDLR